MRPLHLPVLAAFLLLAFAAAADDSGPQLELQAVDTTIEWHGRDQPKEPAAAKGSGCLEDTVQYGQGKATGAIGLSINSSSSVQGAAQWFDAPQEISISGFDFYGYKLNSTTNGAAISVTASLYLADGNLFPTGAPLATTQVNLPFESPGGALDTLRRTATFSSPQMVVVPYVLVVENHTSTSVTLFINDYTAGDGAGEYLSSVDADGTWTITSDVVIGPDPFDADWLFEPVVTYDVVADFSSSPQCLSAPDTVSFTNTSSSVLGSRFYDLNAFAGTPELAFSWDFGDASTITNAIDPSHAYSGSGPYSVGLDAFSTGWGRVCTVTSSAIIGQAATATFSFETNDLTVDFSGSSPTATTFEWDFGDGVTATAASVSHTYASHGFYSACLTVGTPSCGDSPPVCQAVDLPIPIHVDSSSAVGGDGSSWLLAFDTVQDALAVAVAGDQVWVANGIYFPDEGTVQADNDPVSSFTLSNDVEIYGGFQGNETARDLRDPVANLTILSGDIDGDDSVDGDGVTRDWPQLAGTNAYQLVQAGGTDETTVLDGFTLTAGWAAGSGALDSGAAMNCLGGASPTLGNLVVVGNRSTNRGALSGCTPVVRSSLFENNRADSVGAVSNGTGTFIDTRFVGNSSGSQGSVFYTSGGTLTLTNCAFVDNSGGGTGGALRVQSMQVDLDNVLFSGNRGGSAAAMEFSGTVNGSLNNVTVTGNRASGSAFEQQGDGTLTVTNSIFANNQGSGGVIGDVNSSIVDSGLGSLTLSNTLLQGSGAAVTWTASPIIDGGANIDDDPGFVLPLNPGTAPSAGGDFHLLADSVAVNAGDNSAVVEVFDLEGGTRIQGGTVDLGPYESSTLFVDGFEGGDLSRWSANVP